MRNRKHIFSAVVTLSSLLFGAVVSALLFTACTGNSVKSVVHPDFSADSAYSHIERQVSMGPRVPDTKAHTECILYLLDRLQAYGAATECQQGTMTAYDGREQYVINIIGHFGALDAKGRVLLGAHYDSRPWCDEEDLYEDRFIAVQGANDGASGVGVLLEVARQLGLAAADTAAPAPAVDIVFFDCEDMGTPSFYTGTEREHTWCLGSQLWAREAVKAPDMLKRFQYGIVLDMVGAPDAVFPKEYYSMQAAGGYVEKIWRNANRLGHGKFFVHSKISPITDDHYYVNAIAGIPCLDIIHYNRISGTGFPFWWHTQHDDMSNISRETLQAVGETVMKTIK